jgi:hypothetical protein
MSDIYDQHRSAFANVAAHVILKDGARVATVAFKFGTSVTAYVHWIGVEMTKGRAGGGGYDRQSAAVSAAVRKIPDSINDRLGDAAMRAAFIDAADDRDGRHWYQRLEAAGFTVIQAV